MPSLETFRARKLQLLREIVRRPGMFAGSAHEAYAWMSPLVEDLQELYDRTDSVGAWNWVQHGPGGRWDEYGVPGISRWFSQDQSRCYAEVVACFAEVAAKLDLLELEGTYADEAWDGAGFADGERFKGLSADATQIRELIGPPSLVVGNDEVFCYARQDRTHGWAFIDFERWRGPDKRRLARDVRLPTTPARDGLILLR